MRADLPYAVLLFRGRGLISRLIRWQTRSCYSHAALRLPTGQIIEAWPGKGVHLTTLADYTGVDVFTVPSAARHQWEWAISYARGQVGRGYDYWGVLRFISRDNLPDSERWFCSELVFAALHQAGVHLLKRVPSWAVTPRDLSLSPLLHAAHES